jgi:GMP synthase (glutamine-hydrolysing)
MPSLLSQRGDFADWILAGMKISHEMPLVVDVRESPVLPAYDSMAGIVVTGSHAMVTEHQGWSERTAEWLAGSVENRIPILGICYGHQLLAYALGGEVDNNPQGQEFGTVEIYLEDRAQEDALLGGFPTRIKMQVSHTQSVLRLPSQAKRLAYSERDRNQAFVVKGFAWGVQFHPEFDAAIVREYICSHRESLIQEGQNPAELMAKSLDTPYGAAILKRFASIVGQRSGRKSHALAG